MIRYESADNINLLQVYEKSNVKCYMIAKTVEEGSSLVHTDFVRTRINNNRSVHFKPD